MPLRVMPTVDGMQEQLAEKRFNKRFNARPMVCDNHINAIGSRAPMLSC